MLRFKDYSNIICETAEAGLAAKASKSGVSIGILRKVYRRGVAAWNSGHRPGTTPQQWGMARVNSYITKGKGTYHGADKDLREEEMLESNHLPSVPKDKETGLPKKYVAGLSASTAKARAAHFDKADKLSDSDPRAYKPAPGDATAKTKESKYTKKYRELFGEDIDEELYEACWSTYKQVGMKKKGDRMVPDCVPKNEEVEQIDELDVKTLKSYVNKNIKSNDTSSKRDTGLYTATNKIAKTQATSTLDKKVKTLGNKSARDHKNPYEYEASRSELKNRGIHNFAGRKTRTEEVDLEETTPYYNKPSFLKKMSRIAKQERQAREKKEAESKKPVKEETMDEAAIDAKGHKSSTGGLTQKGRDAYNAKGANLQAPVTTPPSKLKAGSKAYNRRKSFCARMSGVDGPMKDEKGRPTRKALALRKWNC